VAHTADEHMAVDELNAAIQMYAALGRRLLD
jgi:acetylornithine deacetylase/succinyl-diaminopimelate desuccinylase-like protein